MNVEMPDGTIITDVPEGTTQRDLLRRYSKYRTTPERIDFRGDVPFLTREPAPPPTPEPNFMDKAVGAGEALMTMGTGATGGLAGLLGGTMYGAGEQIMGGMFGSPQAADAIQQQAMQGAGALTYVPRTEMGQEYMRELEPVLGMLPPVIGGVGMPPRVAPIARPQMPRRSAQPVLDSAGAARLANEQAQMALAEQMPVPFTGQAGLTKGQRTRDFQQLQFEKEAAKLAEAGAPLRERMENQRQALVSNFDELIERQRPMAVEPREIGAAVDEAVRARQAQVSTKVREAYRQAREAGEMQDPADLTGMAGIFDDLADFEGLEGAGVVQAARQKAIKMGIANVDDEGNFVFSDAVPIDRVETFRQFVNDASDMGVPRSAMIRGRLMEGIDAATAEKGGPFYQRARRQAASKFREFNRSRLAKQILGTKRGTDERSLALENIAQDVIVNAPLDELQKLRGTLLRSEKGKQAWQDLKAYGISHIMKKAFGEQLSESGAPIAKPAMFLRAIENMDASGKLQALYGKKMAQTMRDLAELTRLMETAPPGAVNHSNTSSAAVNAVIEMGLTASLTGVPAPMLATLKQASRLVKNKALANRIRAALK